MSSESRVWSLTYDCRPWSLNQERTKHWTWRNERVEEWVDAFQALALEAKVPRLERVAVVVHIRMTGVLADICNQYPAAKAAIDGVVRAGVLEDDDPEHLVFMGFTPPRRSKPQGVTLDLIDVDAPGGWERLVAAALPVD